MSVIKYSLLLIILLLLSALPATAATLKLATLAPEGSDWMKQMRQGAAEIQALTEGRVEIKIFGGGVMGNEKNMLRKIRIGQLQGGAFTGGGLAEVYPDMRLLSLPFLFNTLDEVDRVRAEFDPILIQGLKEHGLVCFGLAEGGFALLMGNHPLTRIGDLKNQKVWVPEGDRVTAAVMQELELSPITLPISDVLTGLQTGLIHIVGVSPIGALAFQWHTRVKYVNETPVAYLYATLVIDRKSFDRLSSADQQVVRQVMSRVYQYLDQQNRADEKMAVDTLKGEGLIFVQAEANEIEYQRQRAERAIEQLSREGEFSAPLYQRIRELLQNYRKSLSP